MKLNNNKTISSILQKSSMFGAIALNLQISILSPEWLMNDGKNIHVQFWLTSMSLQILFEGLQFVGQI